MAAPVKNTSVSRQGECSASFLPAVISTLTSSNEAFQEHEKKELERKYAESDAKLDGLLAEHHGQLTTLIEAFTKISDRLTESRTRIADIKDSLHSCKNLLHCKRDELRRFWLDGLEQNTITTMLEHVENLRSVPEQLDDYTERKLYLHATDSLCKSLSLLKGDLSDVSALKEIAYTLDKWREKLLQKLVDELHHQIYVTSVKGTVMSFKRHGSLRHSGKGKGASVTSGAFEQNIANIEVIEDPNVDPEEDRSKFLAIMVECLVKLNEVPKTIAEMRSHLQSELMDVIRRASQQFIDCAYQQGEINLSTQEQPAYLLELLELVFEQFRCVIHAHNVIIRNLKRVKTSSQYKYMNLDGLALYDISEVWTKIQLVLEQMLEQYLADKSLKTIRRSRSLIASDTEIPVTTEKIDINMHFDRRRPLQRKGLLFSFSDSSQALSLEKYLQEQREAGYDVGEIIDNTEFNHQPLNLVCKPAVNNITAIYKVLEGFSNEIEMAMGCDPGECNLHRYVTAFIKNEFIPHTQGQMYTTIAEETDRFDHLKNLTDIRRQKELSSSKPLLVSTVKVMECVNRLAELMQDLPDYCDYFLSLLIKLLEQYRESSRESYMGVVRLASDHDHTVISATWATDEDISRFLRSLPNWQHVQHSEGKALAISDEEMKSLNLKESQILTTNLSQQDSMIPSQEILSEPVQLKYIGNLHESLEWLNIQLTKFIATMPVEGQKHSGSPTDYLDIPDIEKSTFQSLTRLADDFRELADTCLLLLHLEVRVHCFYYLMPVAKQSNYYCAIDDMDADSNVVDLNKDLTGIEEVMKQSMQPRKFGYIFDGLGHLVASLLINSVQYLKRINTNGVKKMCRNIFAIRQSLTNIMTSREMDLDLARQYYELLNLTMEDIINTVLEQGAKFTELEYIHLLTLIHRSQRGITDEQYNNYVQKLKRTISEKHVYHV